MAEASGIQLFLTALGGGFTVKILDIFYKEIEKRREKSKTTEEYVNEHLDPLLKAADELVGKIRSLAEDDFRSIRSVQLDQTPLNNNDSASLLYLFGRFWAQIEIMRTTGIAITMGHDIRGKRLQSFIECLESTRVRIAERIIQRAVGEAFIKKDQQLKTYAEFVVGFEANDKSRRWTMPIAVFLSRMLHTKDRQKLLQYGSVIHAMIDTLDPEHLFTKKRPSYPHKLTKKSWQDLKYRIFGVYLSFVSDQHKYVGPPKRTARKKGKGSA